MMLQRETVGGEVDSELTTHVGHIGGPDPDRRFEGILYLGWPKNPDCGFVTLLSRGLGRSGEILYSL